MPYKKLAAATWMSHSAGTVDLMGHDESSDSQRVSVIPGDPGDPESGEDRGVEISFDRTDPASVRAAELLIQKRFGLSASPPLCDERRPGLFRRLVRSLTPVSSR